VTEPELVFPFIVLGAFGVLWAAFRIWDDLCEWRRAFKNKR